MSQPKKSASLVGSPTKTNQGKDNCLNRPRNMPGIEARTGSRIVTTKEKKLLDIMKCCEKAQGEVLLGQGISVISEVGVLIDQHMEDVHTGPTRSKQFPSSQAGVSSATSYGRN